MKTIVLAIAAIAIAAPAFAQVQGPYVPNGTTMSNSYSNGMGGYTTYNTTPGQGMVTTDTTPNGYGGTNTTIQGPNGIQYCNSNNYGGPTTFTNCN